MTSIVGHPRPRLSAVAESVGGIGDPCFIFSIYILDSRSGSGMTKKHATVLSNNYNFSNLPNKPLLSFRKSCRSEEKSTGTTIQQTFVPRFLIAKPPSK